MTRLLYILIPLLIISCTTEKYTEVETWTLVNSSQNKVILEIVSTVPFEQQYLVANNNQSASYDFTAERADRNETPNLIVDSINFFSIIDTTSIRMSYFNFDELTSTFYIEPITHLDSLLVKSYSFGMQPSGGSNISYSFQKWVITDSLVACFSKDYNMLTKFKEYYTK